MKTYGGRDIAPRILNLGNLTPVGRNPDTHWMEGLVGLRVGMDTVEKKNVFFLLLPGTELRFLGRPACSLEYLPTTLPWPLLRGFAIEVCWMFGRAIAQAVSRWLPTAAVRGSKPDLVMWDLWWDKVALGQVVSEFFGFPCNRLSLHQLLHNHPHVSSGECTIDQCVVAVLGLTGT
jgi:hypothetical protein